MLKALITFSLRFRGIMIAMACVIAGYGLFLATQAKLDVFPEFAPPLVVINTEAPGLSSEQVEELVTRPVENGVNGVGNLESIRSQSIQGLSAITAIFREGTDIFLARQMVSERLMQIAGHLPIGVESPKMAPLTSSTSLVLNIGFTSEKRTPMELRTFVDWTVRPRLLGVPGVASVVEFGGEVRQIQVQVRPDRLIAYDLSLENILAVARAATGARGAGFIETDAQRIVIRTEGQSLTPEALGEIIVAHHAGVSVRLKDVAQVVEGPEPKLGDAAIMGHPGVLLQVWSQFGANTMEVTEAVERALEEMRPAFVAEGIVVRSDLFRPANFITESIHNIKSSLLIGGIFVAVVLFLFLLDLRTAFISFTAIPLSLLAAIIVLVRSGVTINTITLGGFAIAIGVVVDDAIIDVENIVRRLRENSTRPQPLSLFRVVLDASLEVRSAVVYATFIVALVFLPVLTMSGVQGHLFAPLATAFILATLASLLVALTVTPALCFLLLGRARAWQEPAYLRWLKRLHLGGLATLDRHPKWVMVFAAILCIGSAALLPFFGGEFLPEFREGHFIIQMTAVPGTSSQESMRLGREVSQELMKNPHIRTITQQVGRAEMGEDTVGADFSEFVVSVKSTEGEDFEAIQSEIRHALANFPGVIFSVKTFLAERIEEVISGEKAELAIKIYGNDLDMIDQKAQALAHVLSGIAGASDVQVRSPLGDPQIVVHLRPDRLRQFGFRPVEVMETIQIAYQGMPVAQTYAGNRVFDVTVILAPNARRDPEAIQTLMLQNLEGTRIPLRELADIDQTTGRHIILHDRTQRYQVVTCNVRERDLSSFVAEARTRIAAAVSSPPGVYTVFSGAAEAQAQAHRDILLHSILAGTGILLLLAIVFRTARNMLLVLANLPFALVGGVLGAYLTGGTLSIGSLVGFVTLFGITMRNSIMMISHFEHLVREEGMTWGPDTALRGASERLVPILMTALVTALGLLPIAIGSGRAGHEIEGPMATVILGGLVTSTLLNLFVLPTLALRYGKFEKSVAEGL